MNKILEFQCQAQPGELSTAIDHFVEIIDYFTSLLFHRYNVPDLAHINNDLEQRFSVAHAHERQANVRPFLMVRGSARLVAVLVFQ